MICLIGWEAVSVPYNISFYDIEEEIYETVQPSDVLNFVIDLLFVIDVIISFNTGYYE